MEECKQKAVRWTAFRTLVLFAPFIVLHSACADDHQEVETMDSLVQSYFHALESYDWKGHLDLLNRKNYLFTGVLFSEPSELEVIFDLNAERTIFENLSNHNTKLVVTYSIRKRQQERMTVDAAYSITLVQLYDKATVYEEGEYRLKGVMKFHVAPDDSGKLRIRTIIDIPDASVDRKDVTASWSFVKYRYSENFTSELVISERKSKAGEVRTMKTMYFDKQRSHPMFFMLYDEMYLEENRMDNIIPRTVRCGIYTIDNRRVASFDCVG